MGRTAGADRRRVAAAWAEQSRVKVTREPATDLEAVLRSGQVGPEVGGGGPTPPGGKATALRLWEIIREAGEGDGSRFVAGNSSAGDIGGARSE